MAIVPTKLHKPRIIVGNPDLLRGKFARIHRADRLAVGWCRGVVFQLVKCCGYVGKRGAACIFEVKRCVFVIVLHARPLVGVKCFALVAIFSGVKRISAVKPLPGNFVNGCFFFKTIAVVIVFFSAKGKELTFKISAIKILENQSIKPTR